MGSGASSSNKEQSGSASKKQNDQTGTAPPGAAVHLVKYRNGRPRIQADEVIGCFTTVNESGELLRGPGLLYRLVVTRKKQWAFYNDTLEYVMAITAFFGPQSVIKAIGKAKMWREMPSGLIVVETTVGPLDTELFIEGEPSDGYDIRFRALAH